MRQRYFSPDHLTQSQQYTFTPQTKPEKRLRSNGSVTTMVSYPLSNTFEEDADTIGHYRIDFKKQIGSGYTSKVYKGVSLKDSQQVAVKVLNIKKFSASSLQMLEAEINILRRLNHQNIMKCYDVYKTTNQCYIVTEYCPMGDLQKYMTRKGIFEEKQAIDIITQVSEGIKHLLKNGIIHRDLKPANILQGKTHWKIADFGFAIESENEITTKHNVGTPLYMPPEALIKNLYSPQSDIFAIGIILYQMVVGVTPWQCSSEKELIRRLTSLPLKIPSKAKISLSTKHLLQKLCSVKISERMSKQQFLSLNFNNFSSLDMLNTTYSKKSSNTNTVSKKNIPAESNKKIQTKSKSKRKMLIKVASKDTLIKPKTSGDTSLMKSKATVKQKSKIKLRQAPSSGKGRNQYQIMQQIKSPSKNRKRSVDSSITIKRKKSSVSKQILTQTNIEYQNGGNDTPLSTSIYHSSLNLPSTQHATSSSNRSKNTQKIQNKFQEKLMTINYRVMISQLDYCRFMYYLVRNLQHFSATEQTRKKVGLVIFKHLIKLVKLLADGKNNWFGFMNWESWKKTSKYIHTLETVTDYMRRYEKQYLSFLKAVEIGIVRETNQKLNQISSIDPFSTNLYHKILAFISPLIKESSQNISPLIPSQLTQLNKKLQAQVEALSSVIKYYKLVEISIKEYQNFEFFQENSELFFLKDFTQSAANASMYFKLKDDIKML